jgi:hypothetical protein
VPLTSEPITKDISDSIESRRIFVLLCQSFMMIYHASTEISTVCNSGEIGFPKASLSCTITGVLDPLKIDDEIGEIFTLIIGHAWTAIERDPDLPPSS